MSEGEDRLKKRWIKLNQQPDVKILECKICGYKDNIEKFSKYKSIDLFYAGELIRYKCNNCDVIFGDLRFLNLSKEEIGYDYIDLYSYYNEGDTSIYIVKIFDKLIKEGYIKRKEKGLDYACGKSDKHLEIINNKGYDIYGYDKYVYNNSKYYIDINKIEDEYDYIFTNNYIEHIIDIDDIKDIIKLVKRGGKIIFATACFEYNIEYTHYHTYFFIGRSIGYLEEKLGIKLLDTYDLGELDIKIKVFERI
jgi:hypothetical protein